MIAVEDKQGNQLVSRGNRIYLRLNGQRARMIGRCVRIKDSDEWVYKKFIKAKHIMKVNKSIGLCYELLNVIGDDSTIEVSVENSGKLYLTVKEAKEYGDFLHFKKQGFEKQIFVPLKNWRYK